MDSDALNITRSFAVVAQADSLLMLVYALSYKFVGFAYVLWDRTTSVDLV